MVEGQKIRAARDAETEEWYFSVVDVVAVLTDSRDPAAYWRKLKQRMREEGTETVTNCHGLKMIAADGKRRLTDVATTEISKKEEPEGFTENLEIARSGGEIARDTRKAIERRTGKPVISSQNAAQLNSVVTSMIEGVAASETEAPPSEEDETQK